MCIRSGEQRFYEGPLAFRFPLVFSGVADVREWWDDDAERFRIEVHVANRLLGPLFGYRGSFTVDRAAMHGRRTFRRRPPRPRGAPRVGARS